MRVATYPTIWQYPIFPPKTRYILGLDADVELASDLLSKMVAAARSDQVAVVGARSDIS